MRKRGRDRGLPRHQNLGDGYSSEDLAMMMRWRIVEMRVHEGLAMVGDGDRVDATERGDPEWYP